MATTLIAGSMLASAAGPAHVIWIETEQFEDRGGWVNDCQFVDQMGSPYLLATGMGTPVADAATTVDVPTPGAYRLWARTRDWLPEHHPGRFEILLDGTAVGRVFGRSGTAGWHWEDGGVHDLADSTHVALHDLTGYYGRCDAVVLSSDPAWTPPDDVAEIATLRAQCGGVSREATTMPRRDVVVVGGGLAGCTAAVAAARNGVSVALIQNRPILGGNASTEILVPPVGVWPFGGTHPLDPRETGLVEEYRTDGNQRVAEGKLYSERLLRFVNQEPKLDLYLNMHATGVDMMEDGEKRIAAVTALDVNTGQRLRFPGDLFIDCSGDSVVGVAAGAEYRHGKEPKSMYDEPWAPEEPTGNTMGNGLKYHCRDAGTAQPFDPPAWIHRFPECSGFRGGRHPHLPTSIEIQGQWMLELGGLRDTYADGEEIRDDLLRLIFGLWDHSKNHCPEQREKAAALALDWVGHVTGKRENRRLIGDVVFTQNDIGNQTLFPDRVAYGAWSVDDHYSEGFFHSGATASHYHRGAQYHYKGRLFSIPFGSLYSRNIDNLLMAGRNVSASHLGMSNTRVMLTCAVMGHAAGTAAAMCAAEDVSPRYLGAERIDLLQQRLLKEGAHIIGMRAEDPSDLAPRATVTASSERRLANGERMLATNVVNGYGRAADGKTNAWSADTDADGEQWIELAWDKPAKMNVVHVTFQTARLAPKWFAIDAWRAGEWERVAEIGDNRHRRHVLGLARLSTERLRIVLRRAAGICEVRVYDEPEAVVQAARRAHRTMRLPDRGPWLPWSQASPRIDLPGIVVDSGQAERVGDWTHSTWSSHFLGDGYLHDGNDGKGEKSLRFALPINKPGRYDVRLAYVAFTNRASNVPVAVRTGKTTETTRIDQRQEPSIDGAFVSLGLFDLAPGAAVTISNEGTDGYVVADAVQAIPVDADGNPIADAADSSADFAVEQQETPKQTRLIVPPMLDSLPARGLRVRQVAPEYQGTDVYHSLYLPTDWRADRLHPVLVEYTGNRAPQLGSTGEVRDAGLGYGLSGGKGFIWVVLPYIEEGREQNALNWWGDLAATLDYCKINLPRICTEFSGDRQRIVLCGFSRGAIAGNFLGLADDEIASLWRAFVLHDHYDGVRLWPYDGCDQASALQRLMRLGGRPQLICSGGKDLDRVTREYLAPHDDLGEFSFLHVPVRDLFDIPDGRIIHPHTDRWMNVDSPYRRQVREWLDAVLRAPARFPR